LKPSNGLSGASVLDSRAGRFFVKDPCLKNLRGLPEFEILMSSLQTKYPDHLGLL